jgi:transaldolase
VKVGPLIRKEDLSIKIFADGADLESMFVMYKQPFIQGLTTNPTLMNKAGIKNYKAFALDVLSVVKEKPISFEVFSDNFDEMILQANEIASWGNNVNVKIPVTNTKGVDTTEVIKYLSDSGVKLNVTAVMTTSQVQKIVSVLNAQTPAYISIFAGRIADTGIEPTFMMQESLKIMKSIPKAELIWASPRELLNVIQADKIGCHVITATTDIIKKLDLIGKDLASYSLETVEMFKNDAKKSGYAI